jgi:4-hydroxy-tetrahydrodipicolinate synthase
MFRGAITALITPFESGGGLDFEALDRLVDRQLEAGIEGIVPCGSTGEAITMNAAERAEVISRVVTRVAGRVPVIAGTGGSSTAEVVAATKVARERGADGALINTPAYNKPQQEGLFLHYAAVARAVPDFPIMLYNIPGRSAVTLSTDIAVRLNREFPQISSYKDATANLKQTEELLRLSNLTMLSGDDGLTLPMIALGAEGIVSVVGNVTPAAVRELSDHARAGRLREARELNHRLSPLIDACFIESNPVPAKAACHLLGLCGPTARLPLAPLRASSFEVLRAALREFGLTPA